MSEISMNSKHTCQFSMTERTRLRFGAHLGGYNKEEVFTVIDTVPRCHISAIVKERPYMQTTVHWRIDDKVYIHGAVKNQLIQSIGKGAEACLSFDHFDGYVMAASAINHAVLYRSVIAYCTGRLIVDLDEKMILLQAYIEQIENGRWDKIRQPESDELKMTGVVEFQLDEVSLKAITETNAADYLPGGNYDHAADKHCSAWTGVIPYYLVRGAAY